MVAGDPYLRNFPWPIPDPPKSEWTGKQASQDALRQKALGFNCLNYAKDAEPSLGRHYLPDKSYLDEHCTDGVRFEIMFPSCWNGKDSDSDDHKSHVAYPSLVMDGTCPEGYETRVVSLFFETIWNTYAFKDKKGRFVLSNADPTGYGYHADFIHGWDSGVLEQAVKRCTNPSGQIQDCDVFDIQSESDQQKCKFEVPDVLKDEAVLEYKGSLPDGLMVADGPAYANPFSYVSGHASATSTAKSSTAAATSAAQSSTWTATPTTSYIKGVVTEAVIYVEREVFLYIDEQGNPLETSTGPPETLSTVTETNTQVVSTVVTTPTAPPSKRDSHVHAHKRHQHGRHGH
ncbi:DUF1996 domain-containing protein [Aspergillus melleus]|uniref:DUF1996 domain-containing protein n=1 Tax=Aspergillus melleus TaxID=138277 RepID=UPI001E8D3B42|nr:uncharacterized protein LDX57_012167 [Aspergillus melleus]KAH8434524.1 hypothetical protein LDX57_012167 [Aspergillus melleus]